MRTVAALVPPLATYCRVLTCIFSAHSNLGSNNLVGFLPTSLNKTVSFPRLTTLCVRLARSRLWSVCGILVC